MCNSCRKSDVILTNNKIEDIILNEKKYSKLISLSLIIFINTDYYICKPLIIIYFFDCHSIHF